MGRNSQMFAEERKIRILELLNENDKLLVPQLCKYFDVSPATIRNDLRELGNAGKLKRTHGGALRNSKTRYEPDSYEKEVANSDEKKFIAKFALDFIEDGDTIALDTGTTTFELAKLLVEKKGLTVVTNDIQIALYLEKNTDATLLVTGGILRKNFHCLVGPSALAALKNVNVDKAFMGTNGITLDKGFTTPDMQQAEIKHSMALIANEIIILADSSKFGNKAFSRFLDINSAHVIITDSGIGNEEISLYEDKGINIIVANTLYNK